jgi:phosphoribosylamine--glycine ligase
MRILLIGNGGREHALAWKIADSSLVKALFIAPGNAGTALLGDNVNLDITRFDRVVNFIRNNKIDYVVIGPEGPLAAGLVDALQRERIRCFGPQRDAARLEADKWFAKELMRHQAIPTAEGRVFTDAAAAQQYIHTHPDALVVKAAGLAKGKGVTVCHNSAEALAAVDAFMVRRIHGEAGDRVIIEEMLTGPECSILALVDRKSIYVLESCQDHKPIGDGDTGPMTGGMGAYSPTPIVTDAMMRQIEQSILIPLLDGLVRQEIEYKGVLYAGLMLTAAGPKVLEFNCRFGDPETQPLMMRLKSDLLEALLAVTDGTLDKIELRWDRRPSLCVVAASRGYPASSESGVPIEGLDQADSIPDVKVFHSGTRLETIDGRKRVVTDGGRVLGVTALGETLADAQHRAYRAMAMIHFDGMQFRKDIGSRALAAPSHP